MEMLRRGPTLCMAFKGLKCKCNDWNLYNVAFGELSSIEVHLICRFTNEMEVSMNTKKFLQSFVLIAMLLASLASTSSAIAAPALNGQCGTSVTVASGDTLRKIADRCGTTV